MPFTIFRRRRWAAKVAPKKSVRRRRMTRKEFSSEEKPPPLRMEVVRLHSVLKRYGGQRHPKIEPYEVLKCRGELKEYRYVPPDSTVIYISHEWTGTDLPDPDGTQMYHLLLLLERFQKGEISRTDMDAFHSLLYKHNHTTRAKEWRHLVNPQKTFIWYDGFCVPRSRREDGFRSIPSYIQRCDFMIILAPGCTHFDRIDPRTKRKMNLCYRTYRLQARCVFEMFCAFLTTRGGEQARPALLVRSGTGTPNWISALECQKLAVGTSSFECCEGNHTTIEQCRRPLCLTTLDSLIEERVHSLFQSKNYAEARFSLCFRNCWCRGLIDNESQRSWDTLIEFTTSLRWRGSHDEEFVDQEGFSLLGYAALSDCVQVVQEVLNKIQDIKDPKIRKQYRQARCPKFGLVALGVSGLSTPLMGAMLASRPKIVSLLLEHGADPFETDIAGNDPLMFASIFGRTDNVKFWLNRFPDWDLERKNKVVGGVALGQAVFMGPHRLKLVKVLLDHGSSIDFQTDTGGSVLSALCECEDGSPELMQLILDHIPLAHQNQKINYRRRGKTLKWRNIHRLARFLIQKKLKNSGLINALAQDSGSAPLHFAVQRGDVDVVNLLLRYGADPTIKNDLGKTPVDYIDAFPELRGALKRVIQQRRENKSVTLHRRNSTATNMKFPMYLVPLDQLQRLYGGKVPRHDRIEAHQDLKQRGELIRWENLPIDAHVIFLSHEWVGWNHPDPHGIQLKTFLRVMKRLRSGEISQVEMNAFQSIMYKINHVVQAEVWQEMLSTTYVWIDWASMPQPSACPPSVPKGEKNKMGTDLGNAVKSIPAYVIFSLSHTHTTYLIHQNSRTGT
jgi:hypothetical protein